MWVLFASDVPLTISAAGTIAEMTLDHFKDAFKNGDGLAVPSPKSHSTKMMLVSDEDWSIWANFHSEYRAVIAMQVALAVQQRRASTSESISDQEVNTLAQSLHTLASGPMFPDLCLSCDEGKLLPPSRFAAMVRGVFEG